jgi:formate/nitrite transporter
MPEIFGSDAYSPREIAERVENVGVTKANLPLVSLLALGVLAGGFIGLGAMFSTLVASDSLLGFAATRVLSGAVFSLGLLLVVVAGAELFTGNNLLVMAAVAGRIRPAKFCQHLALVYGANFVGAVGLAGLVALSGHGDLNQGAVAQQAVRLAAAKCALPFAEAFFKGVLANLLVCLAVWLALAGRSVTDKLLAVILPVTAFVAGGFEHSIANMSVIPLGIFLAPGVPADGIAHWESLSWLGLGRNLLPVTLGNLVGGAGLVGLVYYVIYRRGAVASPGPRRVPVKPSPKAHLN